MYEVDLPWSWDSWTIEAYEGRYESTFVTYQGEIVFSLQMFGHDRALPDPIDIGFDEGDVRELWAGHLSDPSFDPYREDHIHTIEEVRFLGRPAYYSYWVGPAQGPAERNFVDLYIARSLTGYWIFISATSDEWTDIDASKVAAFAPVFREFISQHAEAPAT